jgi:hypothetical protein
MSSLPSLTNQCTRHISVGAVKGNLHATNGIVLVASLLSRRSDATEYVLCIYARKQLTQSYYQCIISPILHSVQQVIDMKLCVDRVGLAPTEPTRARQSACDSV